MRVWLSQAKTPFAHLALEGCANELIELDRGRRGLHFRAPLLEWQQGLQAPFRLRRPFLRGGELRSDQLPVRGPNRHISGQSPKSFAIVDNELARKVRAALSLCA